ncbi:uncharacterized protein B0T15DRAFT_537462 [Chaetomium strumarium]|uniref:2EXR domain-containing protein n=1 Tax=Chaetomium strumarium TaxID=1170767 RepID=A0AAJ0M0R5_9PEZI|nr:hypothetical protein B0T15DRAFT_537462 [Chaetomium strumarium]
MADSTKKNETSASFEPFSQFPPDIRQEIWSAAASSPTFTPGVCFFTATYKKPREEPLLIVHEPCNAALLQTNTEAHDIALMSGGPTRAYDPKRDILYISEGSYDNFTMNECGYNGPKWVTRIHHLALPYSKMALSTHLRYALVRLTSLETISIVFPSSPGTFSYSAAVELPADKSTPLKLMTEEQQKGVIIKADYTYYTWAGDFPVQWTSDGVEYMQAQEAGMNRECSPESCGDDVSPLWDHEAKRLGVRWEARCFRPLPARDRVHL